MCNNQNETSKKNEEKEGLFLIEEVIKELEEEVKFLVPYVSYYEVPVEEIIEKINKIKRGLNESKKKND